MDLLAGF